MSIGVLMGMSSYQKDSFKIVLPVAVLFFLCSMMLYHSCERPNSETGIYSPNFSRNSSLKLMASLPCRFMMFDQFHLSAYFIRSSGGKRIQEL